MTVQQMKRKIGFFSSIFCLIDEHSADLASGMCTIAVLYVQYILNTEIIWTTFIEHFMGLYVVLVHDKLANINCHCNKNSGM